MKKKKEELIEKSQMCDKSQIYVWRIIYIYCSTTIKFWYTPLSINDEFVNHHL